MCLLCPTIGSCCSCCSITVDACTHTHKCNCELRFPYSIGLYWIRKCGNGLDKSSDINSAYQVMVWLHAMLMSECECVHVYIVCLPWVGIPLKCVYNYKLLSYMFQAVTDTHTHIFCILLLFDAVRQLHVHEHVSCISLSHLQCTVHL